MLWPSRYVAKWNAALAEGVLALFGQGIIPCSVDSAEFPYITLKCKLKN